MNLVPTSLYVFRENCRRRKFTPYNQRRESAMRRVLLLSVPVLLALGSSRSLAQRADDLPRGARVRITTTDGGKATGLLDSLNPGEISLRSSASGDPVVSVRYQRDRLTSLEVLKKNRVKGALAGSLFGLIAGGGIGSLLGALAYSQGDCGFLVCSRGDAAVFGGVSGIIIGTPTGLLVGAVRGWREWRRVDLSMP